MVPHIRRVWHNMSVQETIQALHVSLPEGLSSAEVEERLEGFGPNELAPVRRETLGHVLLEAITEPMILLLLSVGVLYAFWGEVWETAIVFGIIGILVGVEAYNEWRTEKALESLRELSQPLAAVRRDGKVVEVPIASLVPGDVVILTAGRRVPADLRLVESVALAIDESILTGESVPVEKDPEAILSEVTPLAERRNLAFAGTLVVQGRGIGLIVATGSDTEWGRIARQTGEIRPDKTPLQLSMRELARWTVIAALALTVLTAASAYFRQLASPKDAILSGLAMAFFTIPEELPIIITMVLALGGWRLARQRAIVRRLQAVETLGTVSLIAADKTGTITENRMAVAEVLPREQEQRCCQLAALCSDTIALQSPERNSASTANMSWLGDPTEAALLERARELNILPEALQRRWIPRREFPFDPDRKRMSAVWQREDEWLVAVKGAPESVLACCQWESIGGRASDPVELEPSDQTKITIANTGGRLGQDNVVPLSEERRRYWQSEAERLAEVGYRVLAFAERHTHHEPISAAEAERDLVFVGLVALADPPRPEVPAALAQCRAAGINVLMVTGDHARTARRVASEVGFSEQAPLLTGTELDTLDDATLQEQLNQPLILARATPQHKLRLVQLAQRSGQRVAVTGDGVNDAPALRAADVGIAMGRRGSDVAREAANLILADDNFATLVHAIREGRLLFANLSKSVRYYLACKLGLLASCLAGVLSGVGIPFHPLQIIVLELFVDLGASVALVAEPAEGDLMQRKPRDPRQPFLNRRVLADLFAAAATLFLMVTLAYGIVVRLHQAERSSSSDLVAASSFAAWLVGHVALAWVMRSDRVSLYQQGWFSNRMMLLWTVCVFGFLAITLAVPPLRMALVRKALTGTDGLVILATALGLCVAFRWLRRVWTTKEPALA